MVTSIFGHSFILVIYYCAFIKKIAGKNIKAIISKKIERSGESDTDETAIESVNNANRSMVENDILDENHDVIIIFI